MRLFLLAAVLTSVTSVAQAGLWDTINSVSQIASNTTGANQVNSNTNNSNARSDNDNAEPLDTYTLSQMDCPALEVAALKSTRELELVKANINQIDSLNNNPQYQQQKSVNNAIGALGGLLAGKNGKTGEYGKTAQQLSGAGATPADLDIDTQLALGKKYMSDLDNIKVYQKHKKCS